MSKLRGPEQVTKSLKDCVGFCTDEEIRKTQRLNLELIFSVQRLGEFGGSFAVDSQTEFDFAVKHFSFYLLQLPGASLCGSPHPTRPAEGQKEESTHCRGGGTIQVFPLMPGSLSCLSFLFEFQMLCSCPDRIYLFRFRKNGNFSSIPFCVHYFIANMISSFLLCMQPLALYLVPIPIIQYSVGHFNGPERRGGCWCSYSHPTGVPLADSVYLFAGFLFLLQNYCGFIFLFTRDNFLSPIEVI